MRVSELPCIVLIYIISCDLRPQNDSKFSFFFKMLSFVVPNSVEKELSDIIQHLSLKSVKVLKSHNFW